ncbi:MAG: AmmeMemoRadiSam system radical SAM enzyme [Candidatus Omnitrophota bacterium]
MKEALYWGKKDDKARCHLCPHECKIVNGLVGICGVRRNIDGKLYSLVYGETTSIALDPIEKKPLYHYHPGEYILSLGTKGCNFKCPFCQNWTISQDIDAVTRKVSPEWVIEKAKEHKSFGIAYTYNEPFIWYEFVLDTARFAKKEGLENVLVTNGYVNPEPLEEILPFIDAMNIDLKSLDDEFYRKICGASLEPVLYAIKRSAKSCHVELTNLVIPGLNDSDDNFIRLVDWIFDNLGVEIPLHFSRYFPCYKLDRPVTPLETLERARDIAGKKLKNVYIGNI